jgi:hypothetical protein
MQKSRTHVIVAAVFLCVFGVSYTFLQLRGHLTPQPAEEIDFAIPLRPTQAVPQSPRAMAAQTVTLPAPAPTVVNEPEFTEIQPSAVLLENTPPPVAKLTLPASDPLPTTRALPRIAPPPVTKSRDTVVATAQTATALSTPTSEIGSVRNSIAMPPSSNIPRSPQAVLAAKPPTAYVVAPSAPSLAPKPPAVSAAPKVSPPTLAAKPPPIPVAKPTTAYVVPATRPPQSAAKSVVAASPTKPLPPPAAIQQPGVGDQPSASPALAALPSYGAYDPSVTVPVRVPPPPATTNVPAAPSSSPALAPMPDDAEESQ